MSGLEGVSEAQPLPVSYCWGWSDPQISARVWWRIKKETIILKVQGDWHISLFGWSTFISKWEEGVVDFDCGRQGKINGKQGFPCASDAWVLYIVLSWCYLAVGALCSWTLLVQLRSMAATCLIIFQDNVTSASRQRDPSHVAWSPG